MSTDRQFALFGDPSTGYECSGEIKGAHWQTMQSECRVIGVTILTNMQRSNK